MLMLNFGFIKKVHVYFVAAGADQRQVTVEYLPCGICNKTFATHRLLAHVRRHRARDVTSRDLRGMTFACLQGYKIYGADC